MKKDEITDEELEAEFNDIAPWITYSGIIILIATVVISLINFNSLFK